MKSARRNVVRGLVVLALFVARRAHATDSGTGTVTRTLSLAAFDGTVVAGIDQDVAVSIDVDVSPPTTTVCEDEETGWGCGDPVCVGPHLESGPDHHDVAAATIESATCDDAGTGCTVAIVSPSQIRVHASHVGRTVLHLAYRDVEQAHSGTKDVPIEVVDSSLRIARESGTVQTPKDVFLPGQSWHWCALPPTQESAVESATAVATGPVVVEDASYGCAAFRATAAGTATISFHTPNGRGSNVTVTVVSASEATAIELLDSRSWSYAATTDELLASDAPLTADPYDPSGDRCLDGHVAARFAIADGRYGLVPDEDITVSRDGTSAAVGAARASIPRKSIASCY